ncbi:MAG: hypothetical protein CML50_16545 [Rhodobacteraceae bacterium]|nr:hypothetical protein [Paracoccaceae bacterium]
MFSSVLNRSFETSEIIRKQIGSDSMIYTSWRLNEKHYGNLEGISRQYIRDEYGEKFTNMMRSNFYMKPPYIVRDDSIVMEYPVFRNCYFDSIKNGESKENVLQRLLPYFQNDILSSFDQGKFPIVVTHKHCMRVLMKYYLQLSDEVFETYKIPSKHIVQMNFDKNYKLLEHKFIPFIET